MKSVLITGVTGGMGYATAKRLLAAGYQVYGLDVAPSCDLPISYYQVNLCDQTAIQVVYSQIAAQTDHLYAILHFAGKYQMASLVEISEKDFVNIFDVNLFATYRVNKTFLPLLHRGSRIVLTSSELAPLDPLPFTGIYAITKTAVEKYALSLRMELNLLGIKVAVIRPGAVATKMLDASISSLEQLCRETVLYKNNTTRFREIVNSVETKKVVPDKIAQIAEKILKAKRPKYLYNINRNVLLKLLSGLPQRTQVDIITKILTKKEKPRKH